jgi:hypothetical protein
MLKNFFLRTMMKAKGASNEQINLILRVVEKNPELFQKITKEIEEKVKSGQNQEQAAMEVMTAHREELGRLIQ